MITCVRQTKMASMPGWSVLEYSDGTAIATNGVQRSKPLNGYTRAAEWARRNA